MIQSVVLYNIFNVANNALNMLPFLISENKEKNACRAATPH